MSAKTVLDRIAAADDLEETSYSIPEWGLDLIVRSPSMAKRTQLMEAHTPTEVDGELKVDIGVMQFGVIQACCFDPESGEAVFAAENTDTDMEMLSGKNGRVVWDLFAVCQKMAGLDVEEDVVEEGKDDS